MHLHTPKPDLEYGVAHDKATLAIRPTIHGHLHTLVQRVVDGRERCWVYGSVGGWRDTAGNERFDHIRRGILCGTYTQGMDVLTRCASSGLIVRQSSFYVPCAAGKERSGRFRKRRFGPKGGVFADYHEDDLTLVRSDGRNFDEFWQIACEEATKRRDAETNIGRPCFFPGAPMSLTKA